MTPYERHIEEMIALEKKIDRAKGYRKKDLIRQWNRMEKDRLEYLRLRKKVHK